MPLCSDAQPPFPELRAWLTWAKKLGSVAWSQIRFALIHGFGFSFPTRSHVSNDCPDDRAPRSQELHELGRCFQADSLGPRLHNLRAVSRLAVEAAAAMDEERHQLLGDSSLYTKKVNKKRSPSRGIRSRFLADPHRSPTKLEVERRTCLRPWPGWFSKSHLDPGLKDVGRSTARLVGDLYWPT